MRKHIDHLKQIDFGLAQSLAREQSRVREATDRLEVYREALDLVRGVASKVQQSAYSRIADIVTKCLVAVFDDPYEFVMRFVVKRGRTEIEFAFSRGGVEIDPMQAAGGGVIDVVSFALRLAAILLSRPPLGKSIILDEAFKFVSRDYRERLGRLLEKISEELQVQILLVTHIDELKVGKVVDLSQS